MQEQLLQQPEEEGEEGGGREEGAPKGSDIPLGREREGHYFLANRNTVAATREEDSATLGRVSREEKDEEAGAADSNTTSTVAPRSTTITTQTYSRATPSVSKWKHPPGQSADLEYSLPGELGGVRGSWDGTVPSPGTSAGELDFVESFSQISRPGETAASTTQTGADSRMTQHSSVVAQQLPWLRGSEALSPADMEFVRLRSKSASGKPENSIPPYTEETVAISSEVSSGRSSPSVLELLPSATTVSPVASTLTDGGRASQERNQDRLEPSETRMASVRRELSPTSSLAEQRKKRLRLLNEKIARLKLQQEQQQRWAHSLPPVHSTSPFHTTAPVHSSSAFHTTAPVHSTSAFHTVGAPHISPNAPPHAVASSGMLNSVATSVADTSQQVAPADYRLPGVPSYVTDSQESTE